MLFGQILNSVFAMHNNHALITKSFVCFPLKFLQFPRKSKTIPCLVCIPSQFSYHSASASDQALKTNEEMYSVKFATGKEEKPNGYISITR